MDEPFMKKCPKCGYVGSRKEVTETDCVDCATKLKTLKDMCWDTSGKGDVLALGQDLRLEAIKHIKDMENSDKFSVETIHGRRNYNVVCWIKGFFNISEEDLK